MNTADESPEETPEEDPELEIAVWIDQNLIPHLPATSVR